MPTLVVAVSVSAGPTWRWVGGARPWDTAGLQAALLRVIQDGEVRPVGGNRTRRVKTRFVTATHWDLEAAVDGGRFREDLYARLARWTVVVPPLRERSR